MSCRYGRSFGRAKITAQRAADKHLRTYPTHQLVRYEKIPMEIFRNDEPQLPDTEIPF